MLMISSSTHYNLANVIKQAVTSAPEIYLHSNVDVCARPLYHIAGKRLPVTPSGPPRNAHHHQTLGTFLHVFVPTYLGATDIMMRRYNFEQYLATVQRFRATRLSLVPPIGLSVAKSPLVDKYDLSTVVAMSCGGSCSRMLWILCCDWLELISRKQPRRSRLTFTRRLRIA